MDAYVIRERIRRCKRNSMATQSMPGRRAIACCLMFGDIRVTAPTGLRVSGGLRSTWVFRDVLSYIETRICA